MKRVRICVSAESRWMVKTDLNKYRKYTSEPHGELLLDINHGRKRFCVFVMRMKRRRKPLLGWYREYVSSLDWERDFFHLQKHNPKAEMERVRADSVQRVGGWCEPNQKKDGSTLRSCRVNPFLGSSFEPGTCQWSVICNQVKGLVPFIRVVPRETSSLYG